MKRYYTIDIQALRENNLSVVDSMILENIHFKSAENGWCYSSKKSLAEHHDISRQMMTRYVSKLIENKWLKKNTKHHLKVTKNYINMVTTLVSTTSEKSDNFSFHEVTTLVSTLPIKNERRESKAPTLKEIADYIKDKNLVVNPKDFYEYFEAGNWIDSKGNKVKNWKQKILTWNNHSSKQQVKKTQAKFIY